MSVSFMSSSSFIIFFSLCFFTSYRVCMQSTIFKQCLLRNLLKKKLKKLPWTLLCWTLLLSLSLQSSRSKLSPRHLLHMGLYERASKPLSHTLEYVVTRSDLLDI
ncbi:hypothetical protein V8G54_025381, partial [Vigna mungo]